MLGKLIIKNIVLIKDLEINFKNKLSVLTGETGTGKSILIDSVGLILGNRANYKLIRKGEEKASVTAIFYVSKKHKVNEYLAKFKIDINDDLIIRREINIQGKSSSLVNDVPVSLNTLQNIGNSLIEIQGQFDNHSLLNDKYHINLLDNFSNHKKLMNQVRDDWMSLKEKEKKFNEEQKLINKNLENKEWLEDSLKQLLNINPQENEEEKLQNIRNELKNNSSIFFAFENGKQLLNNDDGISDQIRKLSLIFDKIKSVNSKEIKEILNILTEISFNIEELSYIFNKKNFANVNVEEKLEQIDERIYELRRQANKHKCEINELPLIIKQIEKELEKSEISKSNFKLLEEELKSILKNYNLSSDNLSESRKINALILSKLINKELPSLKLNDAKFEIKIEPIENHLYNASGKDKVYFQAKTNLGSNLGKLNEIASGGELARFLLVIKVIIEDNFSNKTLIFDEVDTGIGGATASAVGEKLAKIGNKQQTIVITHSPQVSAKGSHHYRITKETNEGSTISKTHELTYDERVEEIARMLSDNKISFEARNAASKLLENS